MKLTLIATALGLAASTAAQYDIQSAPFNLVLVSENTTINGQYLAACHTGAAIESLCLAGVPSPSKPGDIAAPSFYFNSSEEVTTADTPGWITYMLRGGNFNLSQPLGLVYNPTSNVALPLFYPGTEDATTVFFDDGDLLNIRGWLDDTKTPPEGADLGPFYRWYSCTTYYGGYTYVTLAWVLGAGEPQNPSCVKVDVKRDWVSTYGGES